MKEMTGTAKRISALMMAVLMAVTAPGGMGGAAHAAEGEPVSENEEDLFDDPVAYDLWVGSTQVTSANKDLIPGILGGGSAKYNPTTKTLTFEGNVTGVTGMYEFDIWGGKYTSQVYSENLALVIDGNVSLTADSDYAIYAGNTSGGDADLTINGDITAKSGICANKTLTVNGNISAELDDYEQINATDIFVDNNGSIISKTQGACAIYASNGITLENGKIYAEAIKDASTIYAGGELQINKGVIEAKSESGKAIFADKGITIAAKHEIITPIDGELHSSNQYIVEADGTTPAKHVVITQVYDLWVGENQVTEANRDSIPGILGGGSAKYDPETKTLTFEGNVTGVTGVHTYSSYNSYTSKITSLDGLKIAGNATLDIEKYSSHYSVFSKKSLTIKGNINATSGSGICAWEDITLEGDINISASFGAVYSENRNLIIQGGNIKVDGGYNGIALRAEKKIIINAGVVEAEVGNGSVSKAIYAGEEIVLSDDYVIACPVEGKKSSDGTSIVENGSETPAKKVFLEKRYKIWVGENQVKEADKDTIPGIIGGGSAKFDPETNTLTFTGNVTGVTGVHKRGDRTYQIYSEVEGGLIISGNASLTGDSKSAVYAKEGLTVNGNLTASSTTLTCISTGGTGDIILNGNVNATTQGGYAIYGKDITIKKGNVKATTGSTTNHAVYAQYGDITIKDEAGTIEAECGSDSIKAIKADKNNGLTIPANHCISVPEDGKRSEDGKTVVKSDGTAANKVKIEPGHIVKFVANGKDATGMPDRQIVLHGNKAQKPVPGPKADNYYFKYWSTTANDSAGEYDFSISVNDGKTLYAIWIDATSHTHEWEDEYTTEREPTCTEKGYKSKHCTGCGELGDITEIPALGHDCEDVEFTVDKEATCTEKGSKSKICKRCSEKTEVTEIAAWGHDWSGWTVTKPASYTEKGSHTRECTRCHVKDTEDIPLLTNPLTVTFDLNGKIGTAPASQNVSYGDKASKPAKDPVVEGLEFAGWFTEKECTTEYDFNKPVTSGFTLYAKWKEAGGGEITRFTVTFDLNGKTGTAPAAQTVEKGTTVSAPADPKVDGLTFTGWYTAATCKSTEKYDFSTPVSSDITLYAGWKAAEGAERHTLVYHAMVAPTIVSSGNIEYWECTDCGKLFADEGATKEITKEQTVILYEDPTKKTVTPAPFKGAETINETPVTFEMSVNYPQGVIWTGSNVTQDQLQAQAKANNVDPVTLVLTGLEQAFPKMKKGTDVKKLIKITYEIKDAKDVGANKAYFTIKLSLNKSAVKKARIKGDDKKALQDLITKFNEELAIDKHYFEIVPINLADVKNVTIKAKLKKKKVQVNDDGTTLKGLSSVSIKVNIPGIKKGKTYTYKANKANELFAITVTDADKKTVMISARDLSSGFAGNRQDVIVKKK